MLVAAGLIVDLMDSSPSFETYRLVVLNLGAKRFSPEEVARAAKDAGCLVLGHAGGREAELWRFGRAIGCDRIIKNSVALADIVSAATELCSE